jgi:transcriptional repressor NrdR
MRCPFCGHIEDKVVDSREAKDGDSIRRRRECLGCGRRFTSYERIDEIPYMVVKKDGKRELFERGKVLAGLLRASEKRPISTPQLEAIVDEVEKNVQDSLDRELATSEIGKIIMRRLKTLDKVAYVRPRPLAYRQTEKAQEKIVKIARFLTQKDQTSTV